MTRLLVTLSAIVLGVSACGGADPVATPDATTTTDEQPVPAGVGGPPMFLTEIDGAVAVNISVHESQPPAVAWITHDVVGAASLELASGDLIDQRSVNGDVTPIAHPIERPAVAVHGSGEVDVAFTSFQSDGASVFLSRDGANPELISGPAHHETNLVHLALDPDGEPLLAWLEDSTLSVARTVETGLEEVEHVDDRTCDCCNPVPVLLDDGLVVAYRDFDMVDGEVVRNVAAVRSKDGGRSFADPVQIADDDWFLDGCPFTGPDVIEVDGMLIAAWMDARQSVYEDQSASTIWVDRSEDGGATFGDDLAIATGALHRWPALAVDDAGVIHLVWETQGREGGLSYAWSTDAGRTWSDPVLLVGRDTSDAGGAQSPSAAFYNGHLIVTWADGRRGYVAAWPVG